MPNIPNRKFLVPVAILALGGVVAPAANFFNSDRALTQVPSQSQVSQIMDATRLDAILRQESPSARRQGNQWQLDIRGRQLLVIVDPTRNRMRIISPVADLNDLSSDQVFKMMVANFHTALDARYAFVGDGTVVALFLHPLGSLQEDDLRSALQQVAELGNTFGTTYSSGDTLFGAPQEDAAPAPSDNGVI